MGVDGQKVGCLLIATMFMSCSHNLLPWQTGENGLVVSLGKTNLGEHVQVRCEVARDADRRTSALKIFMRPACTPKNPLRVEIDVKSPRGDAFSIHQEFPYEFPPETDWNDPEKAAPSVPLLYDPPSEAKVWAKIVGDCDDGKTRFEGAATCVVRQ